MAGSTKSAFDLVRLILSGPPDTRLVRGAPLVTAYCKDREEAAVKRAMAATSGKPKARGVNTTDHVADASDPVGDARNSEEPPIQITPEVANAALRICHCIEAAGASEELTKCSVLASELYNRLDAIARK